MAEAKFFRVIGRHHGFTKDDKSDVDEEPQFKGISGGVTITASTTKGRPVLKAATLDPNPTLISLWPIEAKLDDGRLKVFADSEDPEYDQPDVRLVAKCSALGLDEDEDLIYTFTPHDITANGKRQSLPQFTLIAPTIPDSHDDDIDGEITRDWTVSDWVEPARTNGLIIRQVPDNVTLDGDAEEIQFYSTGGVPLGDPLDISALVFRGNIDTITDAETVGKAVVRSETQADARAAIGAGTSNLAIGTTGSTAKAGNWVPAAADVSDSTATGRTVLTGDAAAGRGALGAASSVDVTAISVTAKTGDPWWDQVTAAPTENATITAATTSQISGGTTFAPTANYTSDPYFRYDGCAAVQASGGGVTYVNSREMVVPEVITDAQDIEAKFRVVRTGTGVIGVRAIINGKLSSVEMQRMDGVDGTVYFFRHQFASAKIRHIKFEVDGQNRFDGVVVGAHTVLQRPVGPHRFRHTAIGDSLTDGGANYHIGAEENGDLFYFRFETHAYYQSVLMGCDSFIGLGRSGTGWSDYDPVNPFSTRIASALSGVPHVLGFYGSINDSSMSSQVLAAMQAASVVVEDVPVVLVCGPQQAGYTSLNEIVRQGAVRAGWTWLNLDGVASAPSSNPTAHPTRAEQRALAKAAHAQVDMARIVGAVEGRNASRFPVAVSLATSPAVTATAAATVTITATLSGVNTAGKVQFYDGTTPLGSPVTVAAGVAEYETDALSEAVHTLTAKFSPTDPARVKTASSAPVSLTITSTAGFVDTCIRADGPIGTSSGGKVWTTAGTGSWVISGNKIGNPTVSGGSYAVLDAETPNGVYTATMKGTFVTNFGLLLRYLGTSTWVRLDWVGGSNNPRLISVVAGVAVTTHIGTGGAWVDGDVIEVTLSGTSISVEKNGTPIVSGAIPEGTSDDQFGVYATTGTGACFVTNLSFVPA